MCPASSISRWRAVALTALLSPLVALAQESVLSISVVDAATTAGIAEQKVTLASNALPAERRGLTDASGHVAFLALPAGTYRVRVTRPGFEPFRAEVLLTAQQTAVVQASLRADDGKRTDRPAVEQAPVVDPATGSSGTTFSKDFLERVPLVRPNATGLRSAEDVVSAAPQVTRDRLGFGLNGALPAETRVAIDGFQVNDPAFGSTRTPLGPGGAQLPLEFLEEVSVTSSGARSNVGRFTGGAIDLTTKSGGNELRGSAWGSWWPGAFTATPRPLANETSSLSFSSSRHNTGDFGAELGGALVKDRLWFYAGIVQSVDRQRVTRTAQRFLLTDDGRDFALDDFGNLRTEGLGFTSDFDDRRSTTWLGKLTFHLTERQTLALTVTGSPQQRTAPGFAATKPALDRSDSTLATLRYTGRFFDEHLVIDASAGWHRTGQALLPGDGSRPGSLTGDAALARTVLASDPRSLTGFAPEFGSVCEPADFVASRQAPFRSANRLVMACPVGGAASPFGVGGRGLLPESEADRLQARLSAGWQFQLLGHHLLEAGADVDWTQVRTTRAYSGGALRTSVPGGWSVESHGFLQGPDERVQLLSTSSSPGQLAAGAFLQERWNVLDAFTVNAGLRWDTQHVFDSAGQRTVSLNGMFSPRVGFSYDFTRQGRSRAFATWGVQHQALPLQAVDRALDGRQVTRTFARSTDCDPLVDAAAPGCVGGAPTTGTALAPSEATVSLPASRIAIDPSLQPFAKGELTAGLEYEVLSKLKVGVVGTHHWLISSVETLSLDDGATFFLGNPGRGLAKELPAADRRYFAASLYGSRAFVDGWLVQGSYTLSSLFGNTAGVFRNGSGGLDPSSEARVLSATANTLGALPGDATHQFRASVAKDFDVSSALTLQAGVFWESVSGGPLSHLARNAVTGEDGTFVFQRGTAGRLPWTHTVNVRGGLLWKMTKEQSMQVTLDVFNLLNLQEITDVNQRFSGAIVQSATLADGQDPAEAACLSGNDPRCQTVLRKQTSTGLAPVTNGDLNPQFKQVTAYQLPLSVRLGVRWFF